MTRAEILARLSAMSTGDAAVIAGHAVRAYRGPTGRREFAAGRLAGPAREFAQRFASMVGTFADRPERRRSARA